MTPTQPSYDPSGGHISDLFCAPGPGLCSKDETRLVKQLFTGYNKVVRPINHFSDAVVVTVGLQLIQLINVVRDGEKQTQTQGYTHTELFVNKSSASIKQISNKQLDDHQAANWSLQDHMIQLLSLY